MHSFDGGAPAHGEPGTRASSRQRSLSRPTRNGVPNDSGVVENFVDPHWKFFRRFVVLPCAFWLFLYIADAATTIFVRVLPNYLPLVSTSSSRSSSSPSAAVPSSPNWRPTSSSSSSQLLDSKQALHLLDDDDAAQGAADGNNKHRSLRDAQKVVHLDGLRDAQEVHLDRPGQSTKDEDEEKVDAVGALHLQEGEKDEQDVVVGSSRATSGSGAGSRKKRQDNYRALDEDRDATGVKGSSFVGLEPEEKPKEKPKEGEDKSGDGEEEYTSDKDDVWHSSWDDDEDEESLHSSGDSDDDSTSDDSSQVVREEDDQEDKSKATAMEKKILKYLGGHDKVDKHKGGIHCRQLYDAFDRRVYDNNCGQGKTEKDAKCKDAADQMNALEICNAVHRTHAFFRPSQLALLEAVHRKTRDAGRGQLKLLPYEYCPETHIRRLIQESSEKLSGWAQKLIADPTKYAGDAGRAQYETDMSIFPKKEVGAGSQHYEKRNYPPEDVILIAIADRVFRGGGSSNNDDKAGLVEQLATAVCYRRVVPDKGLAEGLGREKWEEPPKREPEDDALGVVLVSATQCPKTIPGLTQGGRLSGLTKVGDMTEEDDDSDEGEEEEAEEDEDTEGEEK
ncbi:unnamed protein product [Amoebophrya sp. A25]|nr:unnamed protein product [Amoebophrya sp. A25]|eukprot:GSA25T00024977001.1